MNRPPLTELGFIELPFWPAEDARASSDNPYLGAKKTVIKMLWDDILLVSRKKRKRADLIYDINTWPKYTKTIAL